MKPLLVDINFLLPLVHPQSTNHPIVRQWLMQHPSAQLRICRLVQLGLVRLLSNPRVLGVNALSSLEALDLTLALFEDARFAFHEEPENFVFLWRSFLRHRAPTPKLTNDAYLAALAVRSGLPLLTFDKGFKQFRGLDLELLKSSSPSLG